MIEVISNRLKGRSAVITGGASGIGLATARRFASEGAHVVIAELDPTAGQRAAEEVGGLFVKVDVTSEEEVKNLYAVTNGPVNTPLLKELFAKDPEKAARRLVHVPLGRFAEPEELAAAVAFLASDDASFITASTFLVDGGIAGAYVTPE